MALEKFTMRSLITLDDGHIRELFEQALKRCRDDCRERSDVQKARKVTLTALMVPIRSATGVLDSCDLIFEVDDSLPKRCSPSYNMKARKTGLMFNDQAPDNADQGTFDQVKTVRKSRQAQPLENVAGSS